MILKSYFFVILLVLVGCSTEDNSITVDSVNLSLKPNTTPNGIIECGTVAPQRGRITPSNYTIPDDQLTFGLTIHIVRDDNGENPVLNPAQIANIAPSLNYYFHNVKQGVTTTVLPPDVINFSENIEINYIDNSDFYFVDINNGNHPGIPNLEDLWGLDANPTRFNIYFTKRALIGPNINTWVGGVALPRNIYAAMSTEGFLNDTGREAVMAHELGHNLGLHHTFANIGNDEPRCLANTSYRYDAGDLVYDTPYDGSSYSHLRIGCTVDVELYNESNPTDVCGESISIANLDFLTGNCMSGRNIGCRENFTVGQHRRMNYILSVNNNLQDLNRDIDGLNSGNDI